MLKIHVLQEASRDRSARWHNNAEPWSLLEWAGAMCGESGEAANVAKKIKRLDSGMWNYAFPDLGSPDPASERRELVAKLVRETADSILYGISLLNAAEVDAEEILRVVFNEKSEAAGFPERI